MPRPRILWLLLLVLPIWPSSASAQGVCLADETIEGCIGRLANKVAPQVVKEAVRSDQAGVKKTTETSLETIAGLSSSVKDFLPLLQLSGVLGRLQKDDQTGTVSVALNTPGLVGLAMDDTRKELQLKAVIETSPRLYEGIKKALPAATADAIEKGLLKGAEKKDNFAIHVSYTIAAKGFGRDFKQYQALYDMLFDAAMRTVDRDDEALARARMALSNAAKGVELAKTPWGTVPWELRATLEPLIRRVAETELAAETAVAEAVKRSGISYFGQLVNNQPQVIVTGSHARRDNLFGPSLTTARASFEWGFGRSLNDAFRVDNRLCSGPACVSDAYRQFVARYQNAIKSGNRLAVHFEVAHNPRWEFRSPDPSIVLDVPAIAAGKIYSFKLDYGRLLGVAESGVASGRFDVSLQYERPTELANERWITSVTVTKKIGEMSIPFGLAYASNPKFLTGVDHGLTANVGLKFNLFPATN